MSENIKKIIAISASPSKGRNSDTMLDYFTKGIGSKSKNKLSIEKVYLDDISFDTYKYENKNGPTENEDEFSKLTQKIKECDGIVIATPTYNFSVPAKLKNLIDRIRFIALDPEKKNILGQPVGKLNNHKLYFLVSGGTPSWARFFLFFLFPPFWLFVVFAYYGSFASGSFYSGNTRTFENKKILNKCFKRGQKFSEKF